MSSCVLVEEPAKSGFISFSSAGACHIRTRGIPAAHGAATSGHDCHESVPPEPSSALQPESCLYAAWYPSKSISGNRPNRPKRSENVGKRFNILCIREIAETGNC